MTSGRDARRALCLMGSLLLLGWTAVWPQEAAPGGDLPYRLKTIVDQAGLKDTPEIGAPSKILLPLGTVLEALEKKGEWFKVVARLDQGEATGFIHVMLVEVLDSGPAQADASSGLGDPLAVRIDREMEQQRELVRNGRDLEQAVDALDLMSARVFHVVDPVLQRRLAVEVFYWRGLAWVALGDKPSGLKEFRKMFEVDADRAREALRNGAQPQVADLLKQAERDFMGIEVEYVLEVVSLPPGAEVTVNGREKAFAPATFRGNSPRFKLEVQKSGYKPLRDEVFLTAEFGKKEYRLESLGRDVALVSHPAGAAVFLDGADTGHKTDVILKSLVPGEHRIRLSKGHFLDWETDVTVTEEEGPLSLEADLVAAAYESQAVWPVEKGGELFRPTSIALDPEGNVLVADESAARLRKYSDDGRWRQDWALSAEARDAVRLPGGLAVDGDGQIYLTDVFRHRVVKCDKSGKLLLQFGRQGAGREDLWFPADVALDGRGGVYVVDRGNHRLKKYSTSGELLLVWGGRGDADGLFNQPRAVAVNSRDEVFVLDRSRVQRFSAEGEFLGSWGTSGSGPGAFRGALGLFVDRAGCVYVADSENHRLLKFDDRGGLIVQWGARGREPGKLNLPLDLALDGRDRLLVLERDGNRVQVYSVPEQPPQ